MSEKGMTDRMQLKGWDFTEPAFNVSVALLKKRRKVRLVMRQCRSWMNAEMEKGLTAWLPAWLPAWMPEWINQRMNGWVNARISECLNDGMPESMNAWMNAWMNGWTNEWMPEWLHEWMREWMNAWINAWISVWMNIWTNAWINAWMNESYGCTHRFRQRAKSMSRAILQWIEIPESHSSGIWSELVHIGGSHSSFHNMSRSENRFGYQSTLSDNELSSNFASWKASDRKWLTWNSARPLGNKLTHFGKWSDWPII
jgi:hypothetical protein